MWLLSLALLVTSAGPSVSETAPRGASPLPRVDANTTDDEAVPFAGSPLAALITPSSAEGAPVFADGAECALRLCCASGFIAGRLIETCPFLSPEGKAIAALVALGSGVVGLGVGLSLALVLFSSVLSPEDVDAAILIKDETEAIFVITFMTGALFTLVGTVVGTVVALFVDATCILPTRALFCGGPPVRRRFFSAEASERRDPAVAAPARSADDQGVDF